MSVKTEVKPLRGDALPQYILCVIVNLVSFTYGTTVGWLSPMLPLLQNLKNETDFTSPMGLDAEPLTNDQISWIVGFFCIEGIIGTPLFGISANMIGRKKTIITVALCFLSANLLILLAVHPYMIYTGRLIAGLGGAGLCVILAMYIGETAEDNLRGVLGSYFSLLICLGILFSYVVGSFTSYFVLGLANLSFPILFLLASLWLPETPIYSLLNDKTEDALNALIKLRGNHRELIEKELKNLILSVKEMTSNEESMSIIEMILDPATRKALIIGCVTLTVQQLSGIAPVINFADKIFQDSKISISSNIAAIVIATLQLFGAITATALMKRAGRKFFLLISSIGMALALTPLAGYFYTKETETQSEFIESINWLPVISLAVYIVVFNLGFGPVPWILLSEIFKAKARGPATSFCVLLIWTESFFILKFYASLNAVLGNSICFGIFAVNCIIGAIFIFFYIPETKGKSLELILKKLGDTEAQEKISEEKFTEKNWWYDNHLTEKISIPIKVNS